MSEEKSMQHVTIAMDERYLISLNYLKRLGIIKHRSDGIRKAVGELLIKETQFMNNLNIIKQKME